MLFAELCRGHAGHLAEESRCFFTGMKAHGVCNFTDALISANEVISEGANSDIIDFFLW